MTDRFTTHPILVCTRTRDRYIRLQAILGKLGLNVITTDSYYEAERLLIQEMPHLVYTESLFNDGNAGMLYDKAKKHPHLQKVPFIVNVMKKTKEELVPLAKRNFASALLGPPNPKQLVLKVMEALSEFEGKSPFLRQVDAGAGFRKSKVSVEATLMGINNRHVVAKSSMSVDLEASLLCDPGKNSMGPAILNRGTNQKVADTCYNLFPMDRILGKGRKWISALPEVSLSGPDGGGIEEDDQTRVLFYEQDEGRFESFRSILAGYEFDLLPAFNMESVIRMMKTDDSIQIIFLSELLNDRLGIEWKSQYTALPESKQVPVVVATTAASARSNNVMLYMRKPFGLGHLIEALTASQQRAQALSAEFGKNTKHPGVEVHYKAPCRIVGLDERGGMLEVGFPVVAGSLLTLEAKELKELWSDNPLIRINQAKNNAKGGYYVHFEAIGADMSKGKFYEKLVKFCARFEADSAA